MIWQNVRFLSSQTKPHLDYYNMILAIMVLISALVGWATGGRPHSELTSNEFWMKLFLRFSVQTLLLVILNFDNIFPNNIYRSFDKWKKGRKNIIKGEEWSSFIRLDNLCFCLLEISLSLSSEGSKNLILLKNQFFFFPRYISVCSDFIKMVFCNPQSSRTNVNYQPLVWSLFLDGSPMIR